MSSRTIIFHYHLFKNAGTSLDAALQKAFPDRWVTKEFSGGANVMRKAVDEWVRSEPDAICFSSHTALMPPPVLPEVRVLPVIFVRHPIDRIASAYAFEVKQKDDGFGSVLARNTQFPGYVETRMALKSDRQCRDFHSARLSHMFPEASGTELERSLKALKSLPFVGIVEEYESSLRRLEALIAQYGLGEVSLGAVHLNKSRDVETPLEDRLEAIREQLGNVLYHKLQEANRTDLALYETVVKAHAAAAS